MYTFASIQAVQVDWIFSLP